MALTDHVDDLATAVSTELKKTRVLVNGNSAPDNLNNLTTTAKANLVAAINEVKTTADAAAGGGVSIDDTLARPDATYSSEKIAAEIAGVSVDLTELIDDVTPSTSTVYSSSQTDAQIAASKASILGGADAAYDTLVELQGLFEDNDSAISALTTSIGEKAPLASPALTGTPTAPTATGGTNTTQVATTAFVTSAVSAGAVPAASDTVAGRVELATNAETITGTDSTRAVTPAGLLATVGNTATADFVATFNAGLA